MKKNTWQLKFDFGAKKIFECPHERTFVTQAYVPCGTYCFDCGELLSQFLPTPPEKLGYVSADWKWHYIAGKPWTTQIGRSGQGYLYK
jgi:hypothetical protein